MAIREVVQARVRQLTDERSVLRVLPVHGGKGVGPFLFLDHMGPWEVSPEETSDVGHIRTLAWPQSPIYLKEAFCIETA